MFFWKVNIIIIVYSFSPRLPIGLEDVSKYPTLFTALIDDSSHSWSDEDLGKLASGNILRVMTDAENVRDALKYEQTDQEGIEKGELEGHEECAT
jgi:hypothetical protein